MKNSEKLQKAFEYFKQSYNYKMGGTQTVVLPNGKSRFFDDREYYSGRGARYNSSINHDILGDVKISRKEYSTFLTYIKEQESAKAKRIAENKKQAERIESAKAKGVYTFTESGHIELGNEAFSPERLANTLNISVADAELLYSTGKTYVFAKSTDGRTYQLYHPNTELNGFSVHVEEATPERIAKFDHEEWASAPYAHLVGQTSNKNHFVC